METTELNSGYNRWKIPRLTRVIMMEGEIVADKVDTAFETLVEIAKSLHLELDILDVHYSVDRDGVVQSVEILHTTQ